MTAYFDNRTRHVRELCEHGADARMVAEQVEAEVIRQVTLVCGDREFPDDMRERMMNAIAVLRLDGIGNVIPAAAQALETLEGSATSELVETLHELFHELARRRIQVRFGYLTDSPEDILVRRDAFDNQETIDVPH